MKKIIVTYDQVVAGDAPIIQPDHIQTHPRRPANAQQSNTQDHPIKPVASNQEESKKSITSKSQGNSPEKNKKHGGKDEEGGETLAKRAEMMSEDPFMTERQAKTMDGGSKEKQKKVDRAGGGSSENSSQESEESEEEKNQKELDILVSRGDKILLNAKGVFPFDFFPDTLTIDANKVNIITKTFFASSTVVSVMLKEVMDVRVGTALFLGKLSIDYGPHPLKITTIDVPNLRKQDALRAKEIIEGMLVLYRGENIDTTKLKPEETLEEVIQIGKVDEERA